VLIAWSLAMPATPVLAWGDDGHQIVARIAARKLTPSATRHLVALLRQGGDDPLHLPLLLGAPGPRYPRSGTLAEAFGRMATWPDHMPGGKGVTGPWHDVDFGPLRRHDHRGRSLSRRVMDEITRVTLRTPLWPFPRESAVTWYGDFNELTSRAGLAAESREPDRGLVLLCQIDEFPREFASDYS